MAAQTGEIDPHGVSSLEELAALLRQLRRREARHRGTPELTYRELAEQTGWSHGIIGQYLTGKVLPPTDRFDALIRLLGAGPSEQGALATARDRVEEWRRVPASPGRAPHPIPRQLPAALRHFAGRAGDLKELDDAATHGVLTIDGMAGIGKTALVVHWAHQSVDRFPDGQLYVNLRGFDAGGPLPAEDAVRGFLDALGVPARRLPPDPDAQVSLYRTLLADRRVLVVLDNARDAEQVRPLLPGSPSAVVIVTSRNRLTDLVAAQDARPWTLGLLSEGEARELLAHRLGGQRLGSEPGAVERIVAGCAGLPLALCLVAAGAATRPQLSLASVVDELNVSDGVRAVFSWSYRTLDPAAATGYRLLGLHPGPEITLEAAAALGAVGPAQARARLTELVHANLLIDLAPGRYTLHDLLRVHAAEMCQATDSEASRKAATRRLLEHYRYTAAAAMQTLFRADQQARRLLGPPSVAVAPVDTEELATDWLAAEMSNVVAVCGQAVEHGWIDEVVDLSVTVANYLQTRRHFGLAIALHSKALHAAGEQHADRASMLTNLGMAHWRLGQPGEAFDLLSRALTGHRQTGDRSSEGYTLSLLGIVHDILGRHREALEHLRQSLAVYKELGVRGGEAGQLVNIAVSHTRHGEHEEAARHLERAVAIGREIGSRNLEGTALTNLGDVYCCLGRHDEALQELERALTIHRENHNRSFEGETLVSLGVVYREQRHFAEALDHLDRALAIAREIDDVWLTTRNLNSAGETLCVMADADLALTRHEEALELAAQIGDTVELARAHQGIANARAAQAAAAATTAPIVSTGSYAPVENHR
ncbi:hypothetical protein Rhe02_18500 [Rhizocola hellebori]|uniref:HTH cro/C1-type domain-containing protein n=1 Tax=Rhizocola hellebori TaxID=1392758 RepID=A0A8J3Q4H6_9ACTN|nr:XRE family transcriptional regulator [Rhizocola hellebori]GIH03783.1 hypothetical protein Rhe02_18500 [Rhizocola hellebori]